MKLFQITGNTWAIRGGTTMTAVYRINETDCVLIDPGHPANRGLMEALLEENHLCVRGILSTHIHHDHFGNARYFAEKFGGLPIVLPLGEAYSCRSPEAMSATLGFYSTNYTRISALASILGPVDETIGFRQDRVFSAGVAFDVLHTPGHTLDTVSFRTPDDVLIIGDIFTTPDRLVHMRAPYTANIGQDLASKRRISETPCAYYLMAHHGVVAKEELPPIAAENIAVVESMIDTVRSLIVRPMGIDEIIPLFCEARGVYGPTPVHGMQARHVVSAVIGYLLDRGELTAETRRGLTHFLRGKSEAAPSAAAFDGSEINGTG